MTERKFRGKRVDNGEWIEGDLVHDYWVGGEKFIKTAIRYLIGPLYSYPIGVIPETVGQYIGVKGFGDELIFDGDKVRGHYYVQRSLNPDAEPEIIHFEGVVCFAEGCYFVRNDNGQCVFSFNYQDYEIEVIGNIHE